METMQESVSDISDIVHSMKKFPKLHVLDDACTFVSNSFIRYPLESQVSLGSERRGCFEPPSQTEEPNSNIDCPELVSIQSPDNITRYTNMNDDSQLVHPDSSNMDRFIMGTRLQTRGKGTRM